MLKLLPALLLLTLSTLSLAETPGNIATLCKKMWPGEKGQQSYCIKEKRNYQEWIKYTRKRVYANVDERQRIDGCVDRYKPNYRDAYDCYFNPSIFKLEIY
ncbi:MAG: hypothetical protein V7752_18120 [Halopseudomonas sp.]